MPHTGRFFIGFVDNQIFLRTGIGIEHDFFVLGEVFIKGRLPSALAKAPVGIHLAQVGHAAKRSQTHARDERIAHEHGKAAPVAHHGIGLRLGRCRVKRCARIGPFVHQTRIDRAHHESKPSDDVFHLLVALIDGHRTIECAKSLGQIAKQNALET